MTSRKPTFKQRIRLLECAAETIKDQIQYLYDDTGVSAILTEMTDVIFTEVEEMKRANQRFEARNAAQKAVSENAKTASKETAFIS